uniref:Putative secreted protein n=1 Tax=Anopheles darlingi TaxID=43151 RepID=A0A2M4D2H1_ANODA
MILNYLLAIIINAACTFPRNSYALHGPMFSTFPPGFPTNSTTKQTRNSGRTWALLGSTGFRGKYFNNQSFLPQRTIA